MEAALRAIAEPRRRTILRLVADGELSAGEIAAHFDVTRPAVSQHLTVLREAGLVSERREGPRRLYRARREGLDDVRAFLDEFWADGLARLKAAARTREVLMAVCKTAEFTVQADRREACVAAVRDFVAAVREHEPGTQLYVSLARSDDETRFLHVMVFEDAEAEARHRGSDWVRHFTEALYPATLEPPRFTDFTQVAST